METNLQKQAITDIYLATNWLALADKGMISREDAARRIENLRQRGRRRKLEACN